MADQSERWSIDYASQVCFSALVGAEVNETNAHAVTRALISAQCDNQVGHGLSRLPSYIVQVRSGKVDGNAVTKKTDIGPTAVHIDAGHGFAFHALEEAIEEAKSICSRYGVGIVTVAHSHHFGQAGSHCEALANNGLIGMLFGNSPACIAAWGGSRPFLGTNPIAFAAPVPGRAALVIDMAISSVARGKILAAREAGETIPSTWALDSNGHPTTDPSSAIAGTILPIGDAKGAALALMVEVLGSALAGGNPSFRAASLIDDKGPPPNLSQTILALDPYAIGGGGFGERILDLVSAYDNEPGARLPGISRLESRARAARDGLKVPKVLAEKIKSLACIGDEKKH